MRNFDRPRKNALSSLWIVAIALVLAITCFRSSGFAEEKLNATQLSELAKAKSPALREAILGNMDGKALKEGTAWLGRGPEFFFAIETPSEPTLVIDDRPGPGMERIAGSNLWYASARIEAVGKLHSYQYVLDLSLIHI